VTSIEAPPGWEYRQLGELLKIKHGYAFKGKFFADSGPYIVLTPGNFVEGGGFKYKSKEKYYLGDFPREYLLNRGDLLVAMTEQAEGLLGSTLFVPQDAYFLHNQRLGLINQLSASETDKGFLYYLFNTHGVRAQIRATAIGTKVRHTSPSRIYEVQVCLPPLPTQRRIAGILSAYDDLIENNTRRIALLEEMAQLLYREWFVHYRFPGHEGVEMVESELGMIPEGWEATNLGKYVSVDKGLSYKGKYLTDDGIPMVNLKCISAGGGFQRQGTKPYSGEYKPRHIVNPGDIVFANTDLTQAGNVIGSPAIVPNIETKSDLIISHHLYAVRIKKESPVTPCFVYHVLLDYKFKSFAKGHASGTTVLGLRRDSVYQFRFAVPPDWLLEQFESAIAPIYQVTETYEQQNETLRRTRDLLLPRLVSGEVDVSELEIGR
jgi:type I restriction enzyme S subunit